MQVVDAAQRRSLTVVVQHVTEIVQQCCADERGRGVGRLGTRGALQRMLELRHGLAFVEPASLAGEQQADVGDGECHAVIQAVLGLCFCHVAPSARELSCATGSCVLSRVCASTPASSRIG